MRQFKVIAGIYKERKKDKIFNKILSFIIFNIKIIYFYLIFKLCEIIWNLS